MFALGLIIIAVTCLIAWLNGDTETIGRGDPYYGIPLVVGAWLLFSPVRSAVFGKKKQG